MLAVEKSGKPRDQIVLKDICNAHSEVLGDKGSALRRDAGEFWNKMKRKKIHNCAMHLDRLGVEHGKATSVLLAFE